MGDLRATVLGIDTGSVNLSTVTGAQSAIAIFDTALDSVNSYRSGYGSAQNRLETALRNVEIYVENITAAESRIRDADYAYETAEMAKHQILQQAGISVLSRCPPRRAELDSVNHQPSGEMDAPGRETGQGVFLCLINCSFITLKCFLSAV